MRLNRKEVMLMLTTCPECAGMVSDMAQNCPHCGYPIKHTIITEKRNTSQNRRFRKLPNGFGSIKRLSGKRRKPFAAYPPTTRYHLNGSPVSVPALGYFETYNEAYSALLDFNRSGLTVDAHFATFTQIYNRFMEEYHKKNPSQSALNAYETAYKRCSILYDRKFSDLRKSDFQIIFDEASEMSKSTVANLKKLFNQMYKIAIENDIVDRNYSSNAHTTGRDTEKGVPFTEKEIDKLWNASADRVAKITLIMIYTGYRAGELEVVEIKNDRLIGGLKTKSSKKRIVPISEKIKEFPIKEILAGYDSKKFRHEFYALLDGLGFPTAKTGEKHTPHDCRHTFSWLADKYKMDSLSKHLIMGHTLGADIESSTYGHRTFEELQAEINKIQ